MNTKYYTFFIEQIENKDGLAEYSGTTGYATHEDAQIAYFEKLKNVSASVKAGTHKYCHAEIRDSFGNVYEKNVLGQRVMPEPEPEVTE